MKKVLVNNEKEFMEIFHSNDETLDSIDEIENLLGVEFAYEDGSFRSDWAFQEINEDQEIDLNNFRKQELWCNFPESYPCLVVHWFENDFDRLGNVKFRVMEFVYPSDFST